jgi:succinyl-CoA synthetase alpha subunit
VAIILDRATRLLIQGITGRTGRTLATEIARRYGILVGGTTLGRSRESVGAVPVFVTVAEAVGAVQPTVSFVTVPAASAVDAIIETIEAGIKTVIVYTESIPVHQAMWLVAYARSKGVLLIGPNSGGVSSPGKAAAGLLLEGIYPLREGRLGIVSKSGSLPLELADLTNSQTGQSTIVSLGGDPVLGTGFADVLRLFEADLETDVVVLLGEVGGADEIGACEVIRQMRKPVIAYVAGWAAPFGQELGHAGAIVRQERDTAAWKSQRLREAGAQVETDLIQVASRVRALMSVPTAQGD